MPLPIIPNVFRAALLWKGGTGNVEAGVNVMHFEGVGKSEGDVFSAMMANWQDGMLQTMSNTVRLNTVTITKLDGSPDGVVFGAPPAPVLLGTGGDDFMPQVAALIKLLTARSGRSGRGRIFLPATAESRQTQGSFLGDVVTNTSAAWAAFATAMSTAGCPLGVASYKLSVFAPVINTNLEVKTATQRGRQHR